MKRVAIAMLGGLWAGGAMAAPPSPPAAASPTILHLSEAASVPVKADEIVARLQAVGDATTPAAAQQAVNAAMAKALAAARAVSAIGVETGNYTVWQNDKGRWQAQQSLTLRGQDGAAMLKLAGLLQEDGLTTQGLSWQVSPARAEAAQKAAVMKALAVLRARAGQIAAALGLHVGGFVRLYVADGIPGPRPLPMMMMARSAVAPNAVPPQDSQQSATVSADLRLQ
ncbi:MAG: SIMPL domain-containing protein [Rhodospirillales bacterium]|nr:SIMPL domain-containing protein [Rhodospirillales bacterium]